MFVNNKDYGQLTKKISPPSHKKTDFLSAFIAGGTLCLIGELLRKLYEFFGCDTKLAITLVALTFIAVAAILTGFGLFRKLAGIAGAGILVPITGFANAVVAPAIEFKNEGFILGIGVKIFSIAGPVILYGVTASVIYGILYYLWGVLF